MSVSRRGTVAPLINISLLKEALLAYGLQYFMQCSISGLSLLVN